MTTIAADTPDLFGLGHKVISSVPPRAWGLAAALGLLTAASELANWRPIVGSDVGLFVVAGLFIVASIGAIYVVCMQTAGLALTVSGGLRFIGAYVASLLPMLILLLLVVLGGREGGGVLVTVAALAMLPVMFLVALLPAWPPAQAASARFVSPFRVLAATKGHRWKLFMASMILASLNKIGPEAAPSDAQAKAVVVALLDGTLGAVSVIVLACLHIAAWTLATRQDPGLAPDAQTTS